MIAIKKSIGFGSQENLSALRPLLLSIQIVLLNCCVPRASNSAEIEDDYFLNKNMCFVYYDEGLETAQLFPKVIACNIHCMRLSSRKPF